ncbi:helix-turn-helix transcriptional regulator [bacterium]|nr:helix-turn-helix transcriptional regulator [bacterium]
MQHLNTKKSELIFKALSKVVKEERIKQNKSIRILADEFDLQKSLISRLENCINEPKLISIWSVCEALGIKPSELLKKIEEELPQEFSLIEK